MKKILKDLYTWSKNLLETLISLISVAVFSRHSTYGLKYYKKHISPKGRILILGNGPSLGKCIEDDINYFSNNELMVVNAFFESKLLMSLKPRYCIMIDPAYFREGVAYADSKEIEGFVNFLNNVNWNIYVIIPFEFRNSYTHKRIQNDRIHYIFINRTPVNGFSSVCHWLYRKNYGMPTPMNVLNAAVFCSINLGFNQIDLYGADHSWLKDIRVNSKNETCMKDSHFFDDENHLRVVQGYDLTKLLDHFACTFSSHKKLQKYALSQGVRITNCTPGSFIDAYDRKEGC